MDYEYLKRADMTEDDRDDVLFDIMNLWWALDFVFSLESHAARSSQASNCQASKTLQAYKYFKNNEKKKHELYIMAAYGIVKNPLYAYEGMKIDGKLI